MSLLTSTDDVEQVARSWIQRKYGKRLGKLKFVEVMSGEGVWDVKANVKLTAGVLSIKSQLVHLKIDARSTEILGYSETELLEK